VDIRDYYTTKPLDVLTRDFNKLLASESKRVTAANAEVTKAQADAAQAIQLRNQAYSDYIWGSICAKPVKHVSARFNGRVVQNVTSNRVEVASWPHDGEKPSQEWFQHVMDEQPFLADRLSWKDYLSPKAEQQHNAQVAAATRATFSSLARDYNLSRCESNVQAILQHFPEGVDAFQMGLAIQNQELNLAPCGKAEYLEFTKELEREFENKWKAMPLHEVRKRSAECNAEREALLARHSWKERGVLTKADEHDARQQNIKTQEAALGYPLMPATLGETVLDAAYLRGCDRDKLLDAIRRFGAYQVNQRLEGK
jgi:hypothetical protein